ncbi:uncharacterized protein LOC119466304 isoform X16 [Dermacentor silvarum]|uniref:uncharacterized protein LOC119466304 isoform X16 n=1 Tax=Dermacentor silvarum TaxID=543639 RepID=UPI00189B5A74|nr:uncharacterized protein LOC119466304 isoform X16 [Dermacentor silvarum]
MAGRATDCEDPNLQKYESSLYKFKDERDAIQKKTFTKWVNKHLIKANKRVDDLFVDLQDGHSLLSLLEVLSGETLPREKGRMRFHMLQNVQTALNFLRYRKVKLVNIRAEDIVDGNPKLTLGLIWTIILHFQISDITFTQNNENLTAKDALLRWAQRTTDRYPGVKVRDFTTSWRDGLAFNAIIHRNRPDLVDFRSCRTRTVRENLEVAFSVAERELGVTRLLDPEDVDTPQPDEKSLITYISSLYDVFPEPASHHPFAEDEKLRKAEEYRDLSSNLHTWLRQSTALLQSRSFPPTLSEVKQVQTENARFRQEEVPPRLQDKQRLTKLWRDEVHSLVREQRLHVDAELTPDNLEASWQRMLAAHADRERALRDEATRLEKLQRLAEKVHREAKNCDARLDDVERRISDEEPRLGRLHPADAKRVCDQVDRDLRHIEDTLKALFRDVQLLFDGRYHRASELHKLVQKLHQRWSDLRLAYQQRLLAPLSSKQYKLEERKVTKQRQVISESRLVETHEYLKFLQSCLDWVQEKLRQLETVEWGCEVPAVQSTLDRHQADHRLIDQFQKNVDMCISRQGHFEEGSEERAQYQKQLAQLERDYSELLVLSNKRLSDLDALLEFAQSAAAELRWLQERQQPEIMRDWSSPTLNLVELEHHQGTLTAEVEARESAFNATLDQGSSLVRQQHPAARAIEAQLSALQAQWAWLLELLRALEAHLRHAAHYHQFFNEARECEQWLQRGEERLNTTFSRPSFSLEEGERLLQQMQELREDLARYAGIVNALLERSRQVLPLKQRRAPLPRALRVTAVCSYSQLKMTVARGEQCWLHDNTQRDRWKVANAKGHEGQVPGVCFMIPPPNPEAIELAESLKRKYDLVVKLWTKKQHKLRLNMIFATIKIVKAWDLKTFRAMEPNQRESIIRALNEDAEKLLAEGDPTDPDMRRLREEIRLCNKLFEDLMAKLREEEAEKSPESPSRRFADLSARLEKLLQEKERTLNSRVQAHIPRDIDSLDALVVQHKEFEEGLQDLEPQVAEMRVAFKQMTKKTPTTQDRHDGVVRLWDRIWNLSHLYVERLKAVEIANHGLSEATTFVSSVEEQLAAQGPMPEEQSALRQVHEDLVALQLELQQQQPQLDRLAEDVASVRKVTERSRPSAYSHPDVRKLEDDLRKVVRRWDNAANQLAERLRSCEAASELLRAYRNKMDEERNWASQATVRVNAVKTARPSVDRQQALDLYTEVSGRRPRIEEVNVLGGRFTREAQIYGLRLQRFAEGLEQDHPSLDGSLAAKRRRMETAPDGSSGVAAEVNELNARYLALAEDLARALDQQCTAVLTETSAIKTLTKTREFKTFTETSTPRTFAETGAPTTPRAEEAAADQVALPEIVRSGALRIDRWVFVDIATGREYSLDEAFAKGLLDSRLKAALLEPCGIRDASGTELSLRAAIDKRLYDPERATLLSPKSGRPITVEEAIQLGIIKREKVVYLLRRRLVRVTELSIAEAHDRGLVNLVTGFMNDPSTGIPVSLDEAFAKGWLVRERVEDSEGMTLSYALDTGLVDDATGKLRDQHSGDRYTLREALAQGLLSADTAEVVDTREGTLVTLPRALRDGLLLDTGRYVNPATREQHTLAEARKRQLLTPPLTLKDAHDHSLLDEDGQVKNPWTGTWMTLLEAIAVGLLDPYVKCIVHPRTQEALSLSEALAQGVITPDGKFVNLVTREVLTLSQAVRLGLVTSVCQKTIFNVSAFQDPTSGESLSFNDAVAQGLLNPKTGVLTWKDTGRQIPFEKLVEEQVMQPQIFEMFRRRIGLKDDSGRELTLSEAVFDGVIDPNTGQIRDRKTKLPIPLKEALAKGVITPEGAALLRGLLRITVSTATVTKTITRYVTVSSHGSQDAPLTAEDQTLQEAVQSGLLGPETEWPTDIGDHAKRTPVTPEPIRRAEAHLMYDDTQDMTGEGSVLHSSRRVIDTHLHTFGECGDVADQVDQLLKDVPEVHTVTDAGLPRRKTQGSPSREAADAKDFSRPQKERKVPITPVPSLTADEEESIHTVTYHVTSRHEFFEKSHVVHDMHTDTLKEKSDEVTRDVFGRGTIISKSPDTRDRPDKKGEEAKDRIPTSTAGKQPSDTPPPIRKMSPTKTPAKGKEQPTADHKQSPQMKRPVKPEAAAGKPVSRTLHDEHDVSEHESVEDVRVSMTKTSTRIVDISHHEKLFPTKESEQGQSAQSPPTVPAKGRKVLPLGQTPSEGSPVKTREPFTEHVLSEDVTENKESVLIEEMLEETVGESQMRDGHEDLPGVQLNGGPEVGKSGALKPSPPRQKLPTAPKSKVSPSKSKPEIKDLSPKESMPETVDSRDISLTKQKEPTMQDSKGKMPLKEKSPFTGTVPRRDASPTKKSPSSPERRDLSPPKKTICALDIKEEAPIEVFTLEDRSISTFRQTGPVSPSRKRAETSDDKDILPSKIKPETPNREDVSRAKGVPETPARRGKPSSEQDLPETPKSRETSPSKQKVPLAPGKRDFSPAKKMPGSQDENDVPSLKMTSRTPADDDTTPENVTQGPDQRGGFSKKEMPGAPEERETSHKKVPIAPEEDSAMPEKLPPETQEEGDVTPLKRVPGTPGGIDVSPLKKLPVRADERDVSLLQEVTTTLEVRDISPPKKMPGTSEDRDASPSKKVPETPVGRDVSPRRKAPAPPGKRDVSQPEISRMPEERDVSPSKKVSESPEKKDVSLPKEAPVSPRKREVSPSKRMPGSPEGKEAFPLREVSGTLDSREVPPLKEMFDTPAEGVSPLKKVPKTQGGRDVSPPKRVPGMPEAGEVSPQKKAPGGPEGRDLSPSKHVPGLPEERDGSPAKRIPAKSERSGVSPLQKAPGTPETKDTLPSKHVPGLPERRDVSPSKKTPGTPEDREVSRKRNAPGTPVERAVSPGRKAAGTPEMRDTFPSEDLSALPERMDTSPPRRTPGVTEDKALTPSKKAPRTLEEREVSPVRKAPGMPEGRDVPLPKHMPSSPERRDVSPLKKAPGTLDDKEKEVSPLRKAPERPESRDMSPSKKEPGKMEGKGPSSLQKVPSRPESRDASPPKKAPGTPGARDVSPPKKVPGTPEGRLSPSKKTPVSPEKKEVSPSRKIPGTTETRTVHPLDTLLGTEENKSGISPEHKEPEQLKSFDASLTSEICETLEARVLFPEKQITPETPEGRDVSPSRKAPGRRDLSPSKELASVSKNRDVPPLEKTPERTESRDFMPEQKSPMISKSRDTSPTKKPPGAPGSRDTSPSKQKAPETRESRDVSPVKRTPETQQTRGASPVTKLSEMPEQRDVSPTKKAPGRPESKDVWPSTQNIPETPDSAEKTPSMQEVPVETGQIGASPPRNVPEMLERKDGPPLEKVSKKPETRDLSPPKQKLSEVPEGRDDSPSRKIRSKAKSREASPSKRKSPETVKTTGTFSSSEQVPEAIDSKQHKFEVEVLDIPPGGWYLKDAIEQGLFDAKEGLFLIPGTDRLVSLEETLKMQIVNSDSAAVLEPGSRRTLTLTRALEKNLLSATGHYCDVKTKQTWTMEEAVKHKVVILLQRPDSAAPGHGPTRSIHVTRVAGQPDIVEVKARELEAPKQDFPKFSDLQIEELSNKDFRRPADRAPGAASEVASILKGSPENEEVIIREAGTQNEIKLKDAVGKGVIDLDTDTYTDRNTGRRWKIEEAVKAGMLAIVGAPLLLGAKAIGALRESATDETIHATATCTEPIRTTREITKVVRHTSLHIRDAATGREVPLEEAVALGLINEEAARELEDSAKTTTEQSVHTTTTVLVTDPVTGETMTLAEALEQGRLEPETAAKLQRGNVTGVVTSVQTCLEGSGKGSTVAYQELLSAPREVASKHVEEARYAVPRFEVTLGRATTSQQPTLQKVRRLVLSPTEARNRGIVDKGLVLEPKQGCWLPQNEAEAAGLVDVPTGDVLVPVGRPLSLPELVEQGLVEPGTQRIVHPETGALLTLEEAVLCDIANPKSAVPGPESPLTLEEALVSQVVDKDSGSLTVAPGTLVTLVDAVRKLKVFDKLDTPKSVVPIPKLALTFPVALRRGVVNVTEHTYTHPVTKERITLEQAIKDGLLLPTPSIPTQDSLHVCEAINRDLIDQATFSMKNPLTGQDVSVEDAMESGLLQLVPFDKSKFTSYGNVEHSIRYIAPVLHRTTVIRGTTIIIRPGYTMPQPGQVQNVDSGDVFSLDEAKKLGIVQIQESVEKPTLFEAVQQGLVDLERGLYIADGVTIPINEAFSTHLLARDSTGSLQPGKYTLIQLFELHYDDDMHLFWVPGSSQPLSLDEVTKAGYLDLSTVLLDIDEGRVFTVQDGISSGYIDTETEKLTRHGREPLFIWEAIRSGILVAIDAPLLPMLPRRFGPVTDYEPEEVKSRLAPSKQHSPKTEPGHVVEGWRSYSY